MSLCGTSMAFSQAYIAGATVKAGEKAVKNAGRVAIQIANTRVSLPKVNVPPITVSQTTVSRHSSVVRRSSSTGKISKISTTPPSIYKPPTNIQRILTVPPLDKSKLVVSSINGALQKGEADSIGIYIVPASFSPINIFKANKDSIVFHELKRIVDIKTKKTSIGNWINLTRSENVIYLLEDMRASKDSIQFLDQEVEDMKIHWTMYADNEECPWISQRTVREYESYPLQAGFIYTALFSDGSKDYCLAIRAMRTVKNEKEHIAFADNVKRIGATSAAQYLQQIK